MIGRVSVACLRLAVVTAAVLLAGCATVPDRAFVPQALVTLAQPPGLDRVRIWGDDPQSDFKPFLAAEAPVIRRNYLNRERKGVPLEASMLALSGGADDGAFGAGFMVGWSDRGQRPQFDLVTGVSAGALIAPFAYLGPAYDSQLREVFTRYSGDNIYQANVLSGLLGGAGIADSDPLKELIAKYVNRSLMRRISAQRAQGRVLLIGTTNIDAQRPVYWDLGRIAQADTPQALDMMRKVLLASASIPGVFPPVRIAVTANGKSYEELHVDGGTTREVFFSPADFSFAALDQAIGVPLKRKLYVIRNGKIGFEWEATEESALKIGQRSLSTVLKNQALGDLTRMYQKAQTENIDYNLASIPNGFSAPHPHPFDQAYMQSLFKTGRDLGASRNPWLKKPPSFMVESRK